MEPFTDYDFVKRTKDILIQYESLNVPEHEKYDITLLVNSCVGLLFVAKECRVFPVGNPSQYGLGKAQISKNMKYSNETELYAICRHIRNSIAHNMFKSSGRPINRLCLEDKNQSGKLTFHMEVDIHDFKKFVLNIADYFISTK